MAEEPGAADAPADEEFDPLMRDPLILAWAEEHLPQLRRSVSEKRSLRLSLIAGFVVGLIAHVSGFLLKSWETKEPLALLADLLYTLGWALWTGVVVVVFFQVLPDAKMRQIKRAADAFEAALRDSARAPGAKVPAAASQEWRRTDGS
jgi:hypothetical protein